MCIVLLLGSDVAFPNTLNLCRNQLAGCACIVDIKRVMRSGLGNLAMGCEDPYTHIQTAVKNVSAFVSAARTHDKHALLKVLNETDKNVIHRGHNIVLFLRELAKTNSVYCAPCALIDEVSACCACNTRALPLLLLLLLVVHMPLA